MPTPTTSTSHVIIDPPLDVATSTAQAIQDRLTQADAALVAINAAYPAAIAAATGDRSTLPTANETLVAAILQEITARGNAVTAEASARTTGDGVVTAAFQANDGTLAGLSTTAKSNLVAAINEVFASVSTEISTRASAITSEATARASADTTEATTRGTNDGTLASLTTTVKTSLVAAINEVVTSIAAIVANGWATTARIADAAVTTAKLATGAVTTAILGTAAVTAPKLDPAALVVGDIVWDRYGTDLGPGAAIDGRRRWYPDVATSIWARVASAANPHGPYVLRYYGTAGNGYVGKAIWLDQAGGAVGQTWTFAIEILAAAGGYSSRIQFFNASNVQQGSDTDSSGVAPGGVVTTITNSAVIPANCVYALILLHRTSGTSDVDINMISGSNTGYLPTAQGPSFGDSAITGSVLPLPEVVPDPYFQVLNPGESFGGVQTWHIPEALQLVDPDSANPYGGRTVRFLGASVSLVTGIRILLKRIGGALNAEYTFTAVVAGTSGSYRINTVFQDASNVNIGSPTVGINYVFTSADTVTLSVPPAAVPATAASVLVFFTRVSGSADLDIYRLSGARGRTAGKATAPNPLLMQTAAENRMNADTLGRATLTDFDAAIARIEGGVSGAQCVVACIGDSWFERLLSTGGIVQALRTLLIAKWGDAGLGWVDFLSCAASTTGTYSLGWTLTKAGTWVPDDQTVNSHGVGIGHMTTSDIATPASFTLASGGNVNGMVLQYYKQIGGGTFRHKMDAGGFTTVDTDAAVGIGTVTYTGLSTAAHTLLAETTVAGSQGLMLIGADLKLDAAGVRVHKIGNGGASSADYTQVDATIWQAGLAALAPNLVIVLLGTNDKTANMVPGTFATNLHTMVSRIRAAVPLASILFVSPADTGDVKTYPMQTFDATMRSQAAADRVAYFGGFARMPLNADSITRGLMDPLATGNSRHLLADGAQLLASALYRFLVYGR